MKNKKRTFFVFIYLVVVFNQFFLAEGKSPFTMKGWQFHDLNIPKLEEAIQLAPEYGINFFIFSHDIFRSVEGFLESGENFDTERVRSLPKLKNLYRSSYTKPYRNWQKDLKHFAELSEKAGIPYYLWIHEFDDIPPQFFIDGKVNFDDPKLFPYLQNRYEKLLDILPGTAGFVITYHESDYKIFRNSEVTSKLSRSERIYKVTNFIYELLKRHNKKLILRNFLYEPKEMDYFADAIKKLPDDVIIMSKTTFHEFDPFYPPDDMHGKVGNKKQIIEIDLGVEDTWDSKGAGAYAQTEYIQRYVRRAQEKKLAGMVGRCRLHWDHPFKDVHEVNLYAFSRFLDDPSLSVEQVLVEWAKKRYPYAPEAAPYLASALERTQFINHHGRYHLEFWLTKAIGAEWDDYRYYFGHIYERSRYKWTHDPADKELETKLYYPDEATYNKLVDEKDTVLKQVIESLADMEIVKRYLTPEDFKPLYEDFQFLLDAAKLQREWVRAFFAQRLYMVKPDPDYLIIMYDALDQLQKIEHTPGITYGLNPDTGRRYNIDKFTLEMKWRTTNRMRALEEDRRILESVKRRLDVMAN
ncbi:MAG: hypothetical protein PVH88_14730 [Ignavibacteria bacterium]|jgi:hypothetical protein